MNEFLFSILEWIKGWVGTYGWAMVVFTVMIRLVLTPLDIKTRVSMRKTSKLQPQLQALQKKYANDKDKLNAKTAELYKKEHINPLSSCLPLLLTWPILIAVFGAMRMAANRELLTQVTQILNGQTVQEVTLEPWLWIKNLWMPDSLFSPALPDLGILRQIQSDQWVNWYNGLGGTIPQLLQDAVAAKEGFTLTAESFSGNALAETIQVVFSGMQMNESYVQALADLPSLNGGIPMLITTLHIPQMMNGFMILPILSAVTQIVMTKVTTMGQPKPEPGANTPGAGTGKFMTWFFPIFSLILCFSYSAAFALYWVSGNLVSMVQTLIINKVLDKREQQNAALAGEGTVK